MNEILFNGIAAVLRPILPSGWEKAVLYAEVTKNSYEIFYYCFLNGCSDPIQCYNLPQAYDVTEEEIDSGIEQIYSLIKTEYNQSHEKWSVLTFVLNENNRFDAYFDYSDLSEGSYDFKKTWKEKYLTS